MVVVLTRHEIVLNTLLLKAGQFLKVLWEVDF